RAWPYRPPRRRRQRVPALLELGAPIPRLQPGRPHRHRRQRPVLLLRAVSRERRRLARSPLLALDGVAKLQTPMARRETRGALCIGQPERRRSGVPCMTLHAGKNLALYSLRPRISLRQKKGPGNFAIFPAFLALVDPNSSCHSRAFYINSLQIE